jgi:hypothetical protein
MRKVICRLPEGGTISIDAGEVRRVLVGGDVVDLDQVLVQARTREGRRAGACRGDDGGRTRPSRR